MSKQSRSVFARTTRVFAALCPPVLLATLAIINQGVPLSQLDLNDGAVWLTSKSEMKLGRYNPRIDELDGGVVANSSRFDVLQEASDVILVEPTTAATIDPATVAADVEIPLPAGAEVQLRGGNVAVVEPDVGDMWFAPRSDFSSIDTQEDAPISLDPGATGVLDVEGNLLTVDAQGQTGRVRINSEGELSQRDTGHIGSRESRGEGESGGWSGSAEWEAVTAVGNQLVGLRDGQVHTADNTIDIGPGTAELQLPGPEADGVLVALEDRLLEVPLSGEEPRELARVQPGTPAAPVVVAGCRYGAWAAAADNYVYDCGDSDSITPRSLGGVTSEDELVFRVNRSVVVLNDVRSGRLWLPEEDTEAREPNWQDIIPEEEPEDTEDTTGDPTDEIMQAECSDNAPAPRAVDDSFGVRAGRTRTLEVLANDTTSDCGILAITEFDEIPESFGELQLVAGGRALEIAVAPDASGSAQFTYTVTDGRGSSTPSTATVELHVRAPGENAAPVQNRVGNLTVEQGGEVTYNILSDFSDPDGDDLYITDAFSTASGIVRYRNDGQITFIADGDDLGRREVRVLVSDGFETTEGTLNVDVRPPGSLAPIIDPMHEIAYVDEVITVEPLRAVRTSNDEPTILASVEEPSGTEVELDSDGGTFNFSASQTGTYYVPFTVVSIPHESTGLVRIDVKEREEEPHPPRAVRDIALLPPGGEITINPLANDIDPTRGVLVLQSVEVPDDSGLRVGVLQHQLLQISATRVLDEPVIFTYTVSNGVGEDVGEVIVLPVPASESQRAPVVPDVKVSVRTGGVVTIPVLEGAYDPDGDPITLDRELPQPLPSGEGLLFVSGDLLRYQAPDRPLTTHAIFSVRDSDGNSTSAQLTVTVHESNPETKAPPTPKDLTARVFAGDTVRIPIPLTGIDPDGDGVVLLGQADAPEKGRITAVGADWLEYEALPGESGLDTFTYAVEDWVGQRAVGTVRVGIAERPTSSAQVIARDDEVTVRPGELVEVRVLSNDIDASGGELFLSENLEHEEGIEARVEGRRVLVQTRRDQDGSVLQILYEATNERGGRDTAILTVHVDSAAPLMPPVARDVVVPASDTIDRTSIEVDVLEVAENPSGSRSDLRVEVPASAQEVASVTPQRTVVVTLGEESQTIPYLLRNVKSEEGSLTSYAFITVPALGDYPPMLRPRAPRLTVVAGEQLVIPLDEQIKVAPGKRARITAADQVSAVRSDGSSLVEDLETLLFQAPRGYAGPASISFEVSDGPPGDAGAETRSFTLPITVFAAEDNPPRFNPSTVEVAPGEEPRSIDLNAFTTTPSGEEDPGYSFRIVNEPGSGFAAEIVGSRLQVSADIEASRGSTDSVDIEIDYGGVGVVRGSVPLRVVASSRALARVLDREVSDAVEGQATSVSVLDGAFNPFPDTPLRIVDATVETPNAGSARVTGSNIEVRPAAGFIGTMVTRFRVADGTGDHDRQVEGRVRLRVRGAPDVPSRPRIGEVRDRTVVLSWDAPTANGEPIDRYRVTHSPGGAVTECASTTCTIDGLTNDTRYRFTVAAHNAVGWSEESQRSDEARPDTKPNRPRAPELDFGDGEITATWAAPESPGSPIKNYQLQITPAPPSGATVSTTSTSHRFTGLQNGTQYTIRVRAENDAPDPSDWSDSARMTPAGVPGRPEVTATKEILGDFSTGGEIKATWERPASNGDSITEYRVRFFEGSSSTAIQSERLGADARSSSYSDAKNGTTYRVEVEARNKAGWSSAGKDTSSRLSVPEKVAAQASAGEQGSGDVKVTWDKPRDGGSAITRYQIERDGVVAAEPGASASRSHTFNQSVGGTAQTFRVRARNEAGWGKWSEPVQATATTKPERPATPKVVSKSPSALEIKWDAVNNGGVSSSFGYVVHYSINGGSTQTRSVGTNLSHAITLNVPLGEVWDVRVRVEAKNAVGSRTSDPLDSTITHAPAEPAQVELEETTREWWTEEERRFEATWNGVSGAQSYDVRWSVNGAQAHAGNVSGTTLQRKFETITQGDTLKFEVRAVAGSLKSDWTVKEMTVGQDPRTGVSNGD